MPSTLRASQALLHALLLDTLLEVRRRSEALIADLEPEDLGLQGMADASHRNGIWHTPPGSSTPLFFSRILPATRPVIPVGATSSIPITRRLESGTPEVSGAC